MPRRALPAGDTPWVAGDGVRRPVVAVLDTGVGEHPWFDDDLETRGTIVVRDPELLGQPLSTLPPTEYPYEDPEIGGVSVSPLTGPLDPVAGHGTFIAGLVHQLCPDAVILAPRLYGGSGIVPERDLLRTLRRVLLWHVLGLAGRDGYAPIDVLVLSLGYYHERPEDADFDAPFGALIRALRRYGVVVVVSSGNDGQTRPTYPAAFAPRINRKAEPPVPLEGVTLLLDEPPVLTVGAENPDGTVSLFSNDGPWITCTRPGAALVSTIPRTIDGAVAPTRHVQELWGPGYRATIDPEGFQGGFATWSGTSFAAPVLAGELAASLLERIADDPTDPGVLEPGQGAPDRCAWLWPSITLATGLVPTPGDDA